MLEVCCPSHPVPVPYGALVDDTIDYKVKSCQMPILIRWVGLPTTRYLSYTACQPEKGSRDITRTDSEALEICPSAPFVSFPSSSGHITIFFFGAF